MTPEPEILALCCNWCGYSAADQAGAGKIPYPAAVKIVRLMCTGMIDPYYVLRAFERGFDGVLVIGCHPGSCHYKSGNLQARELTDRLSHVLRTLGIGPQRLRMEAASTSEGPRFAEVATEFTETLRRLGPSPLREVA
ncbi:MAG: methyl-viologen-reducing hydrogenase subunit delta [Euryarchaeota archaeon RBG_19FT_COMBO_69_17]|nr:MAG: methyl-viologen-reducing hydrogenase subunit delta [Euryarchaeota archaeon RBG_19FT_COMBO_69_17]